MQFSTPTLRLALIGLFCALTFVSALAIPNFDPTAKPVSLLGRSYTRRSADPSILLGSRHSVLDSQTQQLDGHKPLGRVARFQIAQRRVATSPGSVGKGEAQSETQGEADRNRQAREILLSHQQLVPTVTSSSVTPVIPPTNTPPAPAPQNTLAPGSRAAVKPKSKKTKAELSKKGESSRHVGHKMKAHIQHE